jgi:hypothetical protein
MKEVESAIRILVDVVVAATAVVAVLIHEDVVECEETNRLFDVDVLGKDLFKSCVRCPFEHSAERDQFLPVLLLGRARLQFVLFLVDRTAGPLVGQGATATEVRGHFPTHAFAGVVVLLDEVLVQLLDVGVDAEIHAVDDDLHEVGPRCGHVFRRDVREENLSHHRRITIGIQQIQGVVPAQ